MEIKPLRFDLLKYLRERDLLRKYQKQAELFSKNYHHPSLHTEILEPKSLRIYSFRIDRKYRAIFILNEPGKAEIIDINDHYQ